MPPRAISSPAKIKNGTASSAKLPIEPNMVWRTAVGGTLVKATIASVAVESSTMKKGKPRISSAIGKNPISQSMDAA